MYLGEFVCEFAQNTAQISFQTTTSKSKYELEFFDSQVLQDARVKVTESGYIPGQAFPTEQAQLDGDLCYYRYELTCMNLPLKNHDQWVIF